MSNILKDDEALTNQGYETSTNPRCLLTDENEETTHNYSPSQEVLARYRLISRPKSHIVVLEQLLEDIKEAQRQFNQQQRR